jgi:hypothetical protein
MAQIVEFLERLVDEDELEARFEKEPMTVMLDAGLTPDQALVILGGTLAELRDAIQNETDMDVTVIFGRMVPPP